MCELQGRHGGKRMSLSDLLEAQLEADEQALDKKLSRTQAEPHQDVLCPPPGIAYHVASVSQQHKTLLMQRLWGRTGACVEVT